MNRKLKEYIFSLQMTSLEEDRFGITRSPGRSKDEMLRIWEDGSKRQLTKDRQNQLLWEEEYNKRRAWEEDHACEEEGGEVWYK